MADSLRSHIADVIADQTFLEEDDDETTRDCANALAAALVADPTLADCLDLAAWALDELNGVETVPPIVLVAVEPLLADWRASRAEQEPTP